MEQSKLRAQLFACLQVEWATPTAAALAQLSVAEWEHLLLLARQQGVAPVLWQRLQSGGQLGLVPAALAQRMEELAYATTVRNLRLYHELGGILSNLRQENIEVIVLKGAHLAATVYSDPALRYMNDIDLLFHPADVPAAVAVLQALSYQPAAQIDWAKHLTTDHHLPRFGKAGVVAGVEIHWTITRPQQTYTIALEGLWARAMPVTLAGVTVLGLCPEDLLLHICEHATYHHHFLQRMRFLCDIDALIRRYAQAMDWEQVQSRAQDYRWAKGVHLALLLAQHLLATPVPNWVLHQLQADGFDARLTVTAIDQFFADQPGASDISHAFAQFSAAQTWREKVNIVWRRLLLPSAVIANQFQVLPHSPKRWLYYPVHYKNLLMRYSGKLWQLWRKDQTLLEVVGNNLTLNAQKAVVQQWFEQP